MPVGQLFTILPSIESSLFFFFKAIIHLYICTWIQYMDVQTRTCARAHTHTHTHTQNRLVILDNCTLRFVICCSFVYLSVEEIIWN